MALQQLASWEAAEGVRAGGDFSKQTLSVFGNTNPLAIKLKGNAGGEMFFVGTCPANVTSCRITLHLFEQPVGSYTIVVRAWSFAHDEALNVAAHQTYNFTMFGFSGNQVVDIGSQALLTANEGELLVLGVVDSNASGGETIFDAISIYGE